MHIGIDATNLMDGGGRTHLIELLSHSCPEKNAFNHITVWGAPDTLDRLPELPWIDKIPVLGSSFGRLFWQAASLGLAAREAQCDVLFTPGGNHFSNFRPYVTMFRNMLPFDASSRQLYGFSSGKLRLLLLRNSLLYSFSRAAGVIALNQLAQEVIVKLTAKQKPPIKITIIPHGVSEKFRMLPRISHSCRRLNLTYVSRIEPYKHQVEVIKAASLLRTKGVPLQLRIIGPKSNNTYARIFDLAVRAHDPHNTWLSYRGDLPQENLLEVYKETDIGIFASSCENFPNILIEMMAASLPIACSSVGVMPSVLGDNGLYFTPHHPESIAATLDRLIQDTELRQNLAHKAFNASKFLSWSRCADQSFQFLREAVSVSGVHAPRL